VNFSSQGRIGPTRALMPACPATPSFPGTTRGTIDPTSHPNSLLQFAMTPGPSEVVNMQPTPLHFGRVGARRTALAGRVYRLTRDVPRGTQLAHDYGRAWMEARGLKRLDVGTECYPMPKRRRPL